MTDEWYYRIMGQDFGPVPFEAVSQLVVDSLLAPDDELRHGDDGQWAPASDVVGLFPEPEVIDDLSELAFEFEDAHDAAAPKESRPTAVASISEDDEFDLSPSVSRGLETNPVTRQDELPQSTNPNPVAAGSREVGPQGPSAGGIAGDVLSRRGFRSTSEAAAPESDPAKSSEQTKSSEPKQEKKKTKKKKHKSRESQDASIQDWLNEEVEEPDPREEPIETGGDQTADSAPETAAATPSVSPPSSTMPTSTSPPTPTPAWPSPPKPSPPKPSPPPRRQSSSSSAGGGGGEAVSAAIAWVVGNIKFVAPALIVILAAVFFFTHEGSGGPYRQSYLTLIGIRNDIVKMRSRSATDQEWSKFDADAQEKAKSVISTLEAAGDADSEGSKLLLTAARDLLPKMLADSRKEKSPAEEEFYDSVKLAAKAFNYFR